MTVPCAPWSKSHVPQFRQCSASGDLEARDVLWCQLAYSQTNLSVGLKDLLIDGLYALRVGQDYIGQSHHDSQVCPPATGIPE